VYYCGRRARFALAAHFGKNPAVSRASTGAVRINPFSSRPMLMRQAFSQTETGNRWTRAVVVALALASTAAAAADSPVRKLDVAFEGDAYVVNAVFFAAAPPSVAWDVLTDFDKLQGWVPNVAESKVVKREDSTVTVEQRGVAKYGAASFPYVTERRIDLKPPSGIKTAQVKGSMKRVESVIALEAEGKGTRIVYHLEIVPSLLAGAVMSKKFVEHEVGEQFTAIVGEMTRRVQ
jgi:carbon monoxide dehydrogenase subunit G